MMKRNTLYAYFLLLVSLTIFGVLWKINDNKSKVRIAEFVQQSGHAASGEMGGYTPQSVRRLNRFWNLWLSRVERDVSSELLLYINDGEMEIRLYAIRALAKIEAPVAEKPIERILQQQTTEKQQFNK